MRVTSVECRGQEPAGEFDPERIGQPRQARLVARSAPPLEAQRWQDAGPVPRSRVSGCGFAAQCLEDELAAEFARQQGL